MTEPSIHSQTPAADAVSLDRRFFLKTSAFVAAGSGHGFNLAIRLGLVTVFLSSGTAGAEESIKGPVAPQAQASYFISPQGSDSNSGTCESPFLTITKARDVVRARHPAMTGDIHVYLRGGTYPLSQTIQFTNADSGRNGHYIHYQAYKDEKPELSGALKVTGWTMHNPDKKHLSRECRHQSEIPLALCERRESGDGRQQYGCGGYCFRPAIRYDGRTAVIWIRQRYGKMGKRQSY